MSAPAIADVPPAVAPPVAGSTATAPVTNTSSSTKPVTASASAATDSEPEESFVSQVVRVVTNCFTSCFGGIQTIDERAIIAYKGTQISTRKQNFGVEYIDKVKAEATADDLKASVDTCLIDVAKLEAEVAELEESIERVNRDTNKKIIAGPRAKTVSGTTTEQEKVQALDSKPATAAASPTEGQEVK